MLARLQEETGVELVEVDRHGELLRVRLGTSTDVSRVIDRLEALGFHGEVVPDAGINPPGWYGAESVGELSREEAEVITRRVVPAFSQQHGIDASDSAALHGLCAKALHECFVTHTLDTSASAGALHSACGRAVENEARPILGADRAAALGHVIEADLAVRSAVKE